MREKIVHCAPLDARTAVAPEFATSLMNSFAQLHTHTRRALVFAAVFIGFYFLYHAHRGLRAEFTHDDLMNCFGAVSSPPSTLVADILVFFRPSRTFRPLGTLVYRGAFDFSGFDLRPFRFLVLILLALNIFLTYCVARRLTHSREIGIIAALVNSYHLNLAYVYYSTGFIYDVLCFFFYFSALAYYLRVRQTGRPLRPHQLLLFCGLYVLALDSKELAVSLPVVIAAYEVLYLQALPRGREFLRWLWRDFGPAWLTALMTLAYVAGRVLGPGSLGQVGAYQVKVSAMVYLQQAGHYLGEWLYAPGFFSWWKTLAIMIALLLLALLARSRALGLCWVLYFAGVLPVAFIPARGLNAACIPVVGLVVFVSTLAVLYRDALLRLVFNVLWRPLGQALLFAAVAGFMLLVHPDCKQLFIDYQPEYREIRTVREQLSWLHPRFPAGSRILVANDAFRGDTWDIFFLFQLLYRRDNLVVDIFGKFNPKPDAASLARYDYLLSFENGKVVEIKPDEFAKRYSRN